MKKLIALVLSLVMTLSLCAPAWGEGENVAEFSGTGYTTLQAAVDAAEVSGGTVKLLANVSENIVVEQAPNVAIVIDGAKSDTENYTISGTITIDGKSAAYATAGLTIQNVNFDATGISKDACINLGVTNSSGTLDTNTRYISNLTVEKCTFTGTGNAKVAIKSYTGGDKNVTVTGCKATGMHSLVQLKNSTGVTVSGCTLTDCKNGISLGASANATISGCEMDLTGYGVRADAIESGAGVEISDCKVEAFIPVVVRNATEDYNLTFSGTNEMTANNEDGLWCAIGTTEYEENGSLPETSDTVVITLNDSGLDAAGIHGETMAVAKVGNTSYATLAEAVAVGGEVKLLSDITLTEVIEINKNVTINGNGHKVTSSASRVFRVTAEGAEVTMNDVDVVSSAVRTGTNDIRGISIDPVEGVTLTLNNCSVDFTDDSANDWAYGVNAAEADGHTITINGGTYEGANAINIWGSGHDIKIMDAKLISTYGENETYKGCAIRLESPSNTLDVSNVDTDGNYALTLSVKLDNGEIQIDKTATDAAFVLENNKLSITGGTFNTEVDEYVADGYEQDEDGKVVVYVPTYTVTVTNGTASPAGPYEEGEEVTITANAAPDGKVFDKWVVTGVTVADVAKETITFDMPAENVTAEATYKNAPVVTYTVTFDANGGSGTMADVTVATGSEYTLPECGFSAPSYFKVFKAWSVNGTEKAVGDKIEITANTEIKAIWKSIGGGGGGYVDTTTEPEVKSPDTFDAGIGLYIGMSVLSVTGSAVLLRKRED